MKLTKKWIDFLSTDPSESEIKTNENNEQYIPIGIIEQLLDEFDHWNVTDFKFTVLRVGNKPVADASCLLWVQADDTTIKRAGGASYEITNSSDNHSAIALSLCIGNAAKKLGNRFGRALNNRCEIGERIPTEVKKLNPDKIVISKYEFAKKINDKVMMEELESKYNFITVNNY